MAKKELLLLGEADSVIDSLGSHKCTPAFLVDEHQNCLAKVALRYVTNHRENLNYPEVLERGLSVGSGEAESGIRQLVRHRMDVAGAWKEENANRVLALITIRAGGWWEDFWEWREQQDIDAWRARQARSPRGCPSTRPTTQERRAA